MMNFYLLTGYLEKRRRLRLRHINRGLKQLNEENNLSSLTKLKDLLSKTELNKLNLFDTYGFNTELSIRQYLTSWLLEVSFNESFLFSIGKDQPLRHPLPSEWQKTLIERGIKVDVPVSTILWFSNCFMHLGRGILLALKKFSLFIPTN